MIPSALFLLQVRQRHNSGQLNFFAAKRRRPQARCRGAETAEPIQRRFECSRKARKVRKERQGKVRFDLFGLHLKALCFLRVLCVSARERFSVHVW
jgi:hypothetical protein